MRRSGVVFKVGTEPVIFTQDLFTSTDPFVPDFYEFVTRRSYSPRTSVDSGRVPVGKEVFVWLCASQKRLRYPTSSGTHCPLTDLHLRISSRTFTTRNVSKVEKSLGEHRRCVTATETFIVKSRQRHTNSPCNFLFCFRALSRTLLKKRLL